MIFSVSVIACSFGATISVPGDYATIQEAINASVDGDSIAVAAGTYNENINFNGKNITLGSLYIIDNDSTHIDSTIIRRNTRISCV